MDRQINRWYLSLHTRDSGCISMYLCIYLSIYPSIHPSSYPSTYLQSLGWCRGDCTLPSQFSEQSRLPHCLGTHHDHSEATPGDGSPLLQAEIVEEEVGTPFCGERGRVSKPQAIKQDGHEVAHRTQLSWECVDLCACGGGEKNNTVLNSCHNISICSNIAIRHSAIQFNTLTLTYQYCVEQYIAAYCSILRVLCEPELNHCM